MQFVRFSLLLLFISTVQATTQFTAKECLDVDFDSVVKNEKKYFGMVNEKFSIKKQGCLIEVSYSNLMETKWIVDVCREPLHIKMKSKSGLSVYKKSKKKCGKLENDFCFHTDELKKYVQDEGLVFAPGEKENLKTVHGQVYCSYLLLKRYLDDDIIFSKYATTLELFDKKDKCELPVSPQISSPVESEVNVIEVEKQPIEEKTRQF